MAINRRALIGSSLALGLGAGSVRAQAWPAGPIRLVVPYSPGGSSDIIARAIAQPLSEALRQPVIVDNKAGANGNLGETLLQSQSRTATRCCFATRVHWRSARRSIQGSRLTPRKTCEASPCWRIRRTCWWPMARRRFFNQERVRWAKVVADAAIKLD